MHALVLSVLLAAVPVSAATASASASTSVTAPAGAADPVNAMCPIGKEPIVASAGTVDYKGRTIGLCCPGCGKAFLAWDEARKDAFVALAVEGREPGHAAGAAPADDAPKPAARPAGDVPSYPYTLPDCPIGGPLGSMGEPVVRVYDGREVRFCCAGCIGAFEADMDAQWKAIDAKIVEQQRLHYPLDRCVVTDRPLGADAVNHVHMNRLVRLADRDAVATFREDPARWLAELDRRIVEAQLADYPLEDCPVGGKLGAMGEPVNVVVMNRLVRLCCEGCRKDLLANPLEHMKTLDAAYADARRDAYPVDTCVVGGSRLGSMGEPVEVVAGTTLVRLCCKGCLPRLRAEPTKYLAKLRR